MNAAEFRRLPVCGHGVLTDADSAGNWRRDLMHFLVRIECHRRGIDQGYILDRAISSGQRLLARGKTFHRAYTEAMKLAAIYARTRT